MWKRRTLLATLATSPALLARAQSWPSKPVKIVVAFAAGGNTDITARIVAEHLQPLLGQPVLVDNKAGAASMIGSESVARAAADGYTLLLATGSLINSPVLYGRSPYDWQKDFAFISSVAFQPAVLLVHPSLPAKTFAAFLDLARRGDAKLTMGTAGAGSFPHLAGELLAQRTGAHFEPVHYRGTAPGLIDLAAGLIQFQLEPISTALPMVQDGRLRALAVTSLARAPTLPDVPTVAESGVPGYEAINLLGLIAPARTPPATIAQLGEAMDVVLHDPKVIQRFAELGTEARFSTPDAFREIMRAQAETWIPVIQRANIKLE
jgi:tripartite-type tricarboxylate transporter receptor subunit TctC